MHNFKQRYVKNASSRRLMSESDKLETRKTNEDHNCLLNIFCISYIHILTHTHQICIYIQYRCTRTFEVNILPLLRHYIPIPLVSLRKMYKDFAPTGIYLCLFKREAVLNMMIICDIPFLVPSEVAEGTTLKLFLVQELLWPYALLITWVTLWDWCC